jgi:hypothetical protein
VPDAGAAGGTGGASPHGGGRRWNGRRPRERQMNTPLICPRSERARPVRHEGCDGARRGFRKRFAERGFRLRGDAHLHGPRVALGRVPVLHLGRARALQRPHDGGGVLVRIAQREAHRHRALAARRGGERLGRGLAIGAHQSPHSQPGAAVEPGYDHDAVRHPRPVDGGQDGRAGAAGGLARVVGAVDPAAHPPRVAVVRRVPHLALARRQTRAGLRLVRRRCRQREEGGAFDAGLRHAFARQRQERVSIHEKSITQRRRVDYKGTETPSCFSLGFLCVSV